MKTIFSIAVLLFSIFTQYAFSETTPSSYLCDGYNTYFKIDKQTCLANSTFKTAIHSLEFPVDFNLEDNLKQVIYTIIAPFSSEQPENVTTNVNSTINDWFNEINKEVLTLAGAFKVSDGKSNQVNDSRIDFDDDNVLDFDGHSGLDFDDLLDNLRFNSFFTNDISKNVDDFLSESWDILTGSSFEGIGDTLGDVLNETSQIFTDPFDIFDQDILNVTEIWENTSDIVDDLNPFSENDRIGSFFEDIFN